MRNLLLASACAALCFGSSALADHVPVDDEPIELPAGDIVAIKQGYFAVVGSNLVTQYVVFSSSDSVGAANFLNDEFMASRLPTVPDLDGAFLAGQMNYRGMNIVGSLSSGADGPWGQGASPTTNLHIYVTDISGVTFNDVMGGHVPLGYDDAAADADGFYEASIGCGAFYWGYKGEEVTFPTPMGPSRRAEVYERYMDSLENGPAGVCLQHVSAAHSAVDPVVGNPDSLQGLIVRTGLELGGGQDPFQMGVTDEPELLSAGATLFSALGSDGERFEARLQKAWPVLGQRARLLIDAPISVSDWEETAVSGHVSAALDFPVVEGRWSVTPRVAFGITSSDELGGDGEMWSASLASRYLVPGVAGGRLVIGNMVAHTATTETGISGADVNPDLSNWAFRNGAAFELPGAAWRVGYVFTNYTGDDLFVDQHHEVAVDFLGLSAARVGLRGTVGDDYEAITLSAGLRF